MQNQKLSSSIPGLQNLKTIWRENIITSSRTPYIIGDKKTFNNNNTNFISRGSLKKSFWNSYEFIKELMRYFEWWTTSLSENAQEEIRWWAIAKGPGKTIGAFSPALSTLKSEAKLLFSSSPLHICSTFSAAVLWVSLYLADVNAFLTSSLLYHWASRKACCGISCCQLNKPNKRNWDKQKLSA